MTFSFLLLFCVRLNFFLICLLTPSFLVLPDVSNYLNTFINAHLTVTTIHHNCTPISFHDPVALSIDLRRSIYPIFNFQFFGANFSEQYLPLLWMVSYSLCRNNVFQNTIWHILFFLMYIILHGGNNACTWNKKQLVDLDKKISHDRILLLTVFYYYDNPVYYVLCKRPKIRSGCFH